MVYSISSLSLNRTHSLLVLLVLLLSLSSNRQALAICVNNNNFTYPDPFEEQSTLNCKQIRIKEYRRVAMCPLPEVNKNCPHTCGSCCEDDPTYTFRLLYSKERVGCQWITNNPTKKEHRFVNYCTKNNTQGKFISQGRRTVRDGCPVTCDFCFTGDKEITSAPINTPTPTSAPTTVCTDNTSYEFPLKSTGRLVGCSWLDAHHDPIVDERRKSVYCNLDDEVKKSCCISCMGWGEPTPAPSARSTSKPPSKAPTICTDNPSFMFRSHASADLVSYSCDWLTKHKHDFIDETRKIRYCPNAEINTQCCMACLEISVPIEVQMVGGSNLELVWEYRGSNDGTGTSYSGAFYKPILPAGFHSIGHYGQPGIHPPTGSLIVVKVNDPEVMRIPYGFHKIWTSRGLTTNVSFWRPRCPYNYGSLGDVVQSGYDEPPTDTVVCLKASLFDLYSGFGVGAKVGSMVWNDIHTEADQQGSFWNIDPFDPTKGLASGTFVGSSTRNEPVLSPSFRLYVLKKTYDPFPVPIQEPL